MLLEADGHYEIPAGKIASVVTSLDMSAPPPRRPDPPAIPWRLDRLDQADCAAYRALFRRVGAEWLWFSRLKMPDPELRAIIADPQVEIYRLMAEEGGAGLLELDFRQSGICELSFFGVVPALIGSGAGRWLMNRALDRAWARPISRFWVHSCTLDHPAALGFYIRSGFRPYRRQIEIADDPRLTGILRSDMAAQIPTL